MDYMAAKELVASIFGWFFRSGTDTGTLMLGTAAIFTSFAWRKQKKTERQLAFLDELNATTLSYIQSIQPAFFFLNTFFKSFVSIDQSEDLFVQALSETGEGLAQEFSARIEEAKEHMKSLRALSVKGTSFGFPSYNACRDNCLGLAKHYDYLITISNGLNRIIAAKIRAADTEAKKTVQTILEYNHENTRTQMSEQGSKVNDYINKQYARLLR